MTSPVVQAAQSRADALRASMAELSADANFRRFMQEIGSMKDEAVREACSAEHPDKVLGEIESYLRILDLYEEHGDANRLTD